MPASTQYEVLLDFTNDTHDCATVQLLRNYGRNSGAIVLLHPGESITLVLDAGQSAALRCIWYGDCRCRLGLSVRSKDSVEGRERNVSIHSLLHYLPSLTDVFAIVLYLFVEHGRGGISTAVSPSSSLVAHTPCRKRRLTHGGLYTASPSIGYGEICVFACGMTRSIGSGTRHRNRCVSAAHSFPLRQEAAYIPHIPGRSPLFPS